MGAKTFVIYATNYGVEITVDEARPLCKLWKDTFPETYAYLENPGPELDETAPAVTPYDDEETARKKEIFKYKAVTLSGRKRGRCSYTQACNTCFQGHGADCTKTAMWNLYKSGYRLENMIHDETITLLPFDRNLTARAQHVCKVMIDSMMSLTPHVTVRAEPALMFSWQKSAEPYYADGILLPWEMVPRDRDGHEIEWDDLTDDGRQQLKDNIEYMYDWAEKARSMYA